MFRFALILAYLIAAVCGPRPCCCAAPVLPKPVQSAKPPAPPKCPLCAAAEEAKKPEPKPDKKPDCPCQKSRPAPTPDAVLPTAVGEDARLIADGPFADPSVNLTLAVHPDRLPMTLGPPPDPSHHLLQLCHRLRC